MLNFYTLQGKADNDANFILYQEDFLVRYQRNGLMISNKSKKISVLLILLGTAVDEIRKDVHNVVCPRLVLVFLRTCQVLLHIANLSRTPHVELFTLDFP